MHRRHNHDLTSLKTELNILVQTLYARRAVKFVGHTFRHPNHQLFVLLSLPLPRRFTSLRLLGRGGVASDSAQSLHDFLSHIGVDIQPLVVGRLGVRGQSGHVFRWGEGWFWELRDGGPGWSFQKHDEDAITFRTDLLVEIFRRKPSALPRMVADVPMLPLSLDNG